MVDWISWLLAVADDPYLYLPLLFVYAVLATVILPIPEEVGLLNPYLPPVALVLTMALGKAVGGALIFPLGERIGQQLERTASRWPRVSRLYRWTSELVGRRGYYALFGLLCIPFMTDTAPVYAFAVLNPRKETPTPPGAATPPRGTRARRALEWGPFVLVNLAAGIVRSVAFLAIPLALGWK